LPTIGERFREWFEAPSYEEGVGVDGGTEGLPSEEEGVVVTLQGGTLREEYPLGGTEER